MSNIKLASAFLLVAALAGSAGACGIIQDGPIVHLWSQTPEILPYVDRFNSNQDKYKVEVSYVASPAEELIPSQTVPDLVLSERLSAPRCAAKLENLAALLHGNGLDEKQFYRDLFRLHQFQNATVALPFAFDLPVIVFRKDSFPKGLPARISLDDLKIAAQAYVKISKTKPVALGFSPIWNQDFLFDTATLFGVDFHAEQGRTLVWQDKQLDDWLAYLTDWCETKNGGFSVESEFVKKYLYGAPYRLLQERIPQDKKTDFHRINFYCGLASDFFAIPGVNRENLEMAWMSRNGRIPVDVGVLFFGVPRGADNRGGAYEFLKWVLTSGAQKGIIEENERKNPLSFGVAGGFSSLMDINEQVIPLHLPLLKGRIPSEKELVFPGPLPETWEKLKNETVLPWLFGRLSRTAGLASLKDTIK